MRRRVSSAPKKRIPIATTFFSSSYSFLVAQLVNHLLKVPQSGPIGPSHLRYNNVTERRDAAEGVVSRAIRNKVSVPLQ